MAGEFHRFTAPDGASLAARVGGVAGGQPIVFVHGFSQGALCWMRQFEGSLAERYRLIAPDLRGHGASEAGADLEALADGATWGGDLAAAVAAFCEGRPPVLVGWSYGGRVLCEYLRLGGLARGLVFVGAVTETATREQFGPVASLTPKMCATDPAISMPATAQFIDGCTAAPLDPATRDLLLVANGAVSPEVRTAMLRLVSDNAALLAACTVPMLVIHGAEDRVVVPETGKALSDRTGAPLLMYDNVGHAPFLEVAKRFDADLAAFVGD